MWQKFKQAPLHVKLMVLAVIGMSIGLGGLTDNFFSAILVAGILCFVTAVVTFLQIERL
jgi:hypothetical protein